MKRFWPRYRFLTPRRHARFGERGVPVGGTGRPRRRYYSSWDDDDVHNRTRVEREALRYEGNADV